jgi:DNA-binding XRE family transcriptional regulator
MTYQAIVKNADGRTLVTFPNCSGCLARVAAGRDVLGSAIAALSVWLEEQLDRGLLPPFPRPVKRLLPAGARWIRVPVPTLLAVRIQLRAARLTGGVSQRQLARRLGLSQQHVAQLESRNANPTLTKLVDVAAALGYQVAVTLVPGPRVPAAVS